MTARVITTEMSWQALMENVIEVTCDYAARNYERANRARPNRADYQDWAITIQSDWERSSCDIICTVQCADELHVLRWKASADAAQGIWWLKPIKS